MSDVTVTSSVSRYVHYNPISVEAYDFDMSGNLMPCRVESHRLPLDVERTLFAKERTIRARLTEKSSVTDLVELVEKYAVDPKFRMILFWFIMVDFAYERDLHDLSDLADMRYSILKSNWTCMDILPGQPVVSHFADMRH